MPGLTATATSPGLASFVKTLRDHSSESALQSLIALIKRRQIRQSRPCAVATTHLFLKIIADSKFKNLTELLENIRDIGRRLAAAQPKEVAPSNIVRRVLGLIREISEPAADREGGSLSDLQPPPASPASPRATKRKSVDLSAGRVSMKDLRDDVLNGLRELLDELDQADEQIAGYANDFIHAHEVILTYTASLTVQKFLIQSAKRRKFTVIHVEGYPNEHEATYDTIQNGRKRNDADATEQDGRLKALTAAGISVVIVPDSAVYAVMARVNKVILSAHTVFPDGGLIAAAGSELIAYAARAHGVPVLALSPIYKLTPLVAFDPDAFTEVGDSAEVLNHRETSLANTVEVINPLSDYIRPDNVDLIVTNIGGFAVSYIYRIVADHYRSEDNEL